MDRAGFREIVHLVASLLVLTIAFSYPGTGMEALGIAAIGVGSGFLLHELAHKFTAQRYGYVADYEASPMGLLMAIGLSVLTNGSFVFAAPGAVMIRGKWTRTEDIYSEPAKEFAYISVSGAVVNLALAVSFYTASLLVGQGLAHAVLTKSAFINVFLAGFNMIPLGPLDGAKVWRYNPVLWGLVGIPAIILFFALTQLS
jgi:Zn-dependent protease